MYGFVSRFWTTRSTPSRRVAIVPIAAICEVGIDAGNTVKIDVLREGSRRTFEVVVAEAPVERGS